MIELEPDEPGRRPGGGDSQRSAVAGVASPYSTGGGGTALEHKYGAVLLAHLLTEDPVPMLGDDVALREVHFQAASAASPVDDFVLTGEAPDGSRRRLSIAMRRAPSFVPSNLPTLELLGDLLKVVTAEWPEVEAGRWRLGLAVARAGSIADIGALGEIARGCANAEDFGREVAAPGRTNAAARKRLDHLHRSVARAAARVAPSGVATRVLTWRILANLRVTTAHLEGLDESTRTSTVARLREVTWDGDLGAGDTLFTRLVELAQRYGPEAARVTSELVRRDLAGVPLVRIRSFARQWAVLEGLGERARDRTRFALEDSRASLELPRSDLVDGLLAKVGLGASASALVVRGEPDVGKSSLVLRTAERLLAGGAEVITLSLRDVPPRTVEFEALLGDDLDDILASAATEVARVLIVDGAEAVLEGHDLALQDLSTSALRQGYVVIAVSRSDGANAVSECLGRACTSAAVGDRSEFDVPPLSEGELTELARAFPSLRPLLGDVRTARLLARPGLTEQVLSAGPSDRGGTALSEADVFTATWMATVRRGERAAPGEAGPDHREQAMLALARRVLGTSTADPDPGALPSLRRDGLLLPVRGAWAGSTDFASDLVRDFALTRLLLLEGWEPLEQASAPRWAIRAVRLVCQVRLLRGDPDREVERQRLASEFKDLGAQFGSRWAEIPSEALLTLGNAREALAAAWPSFAASGSDDLSTLLRLAQQRYVDGGFGDTVVLAPLVELAFCGATDHGQHDRYARGTGETIRKLVLAWLSGLITERMGPTELRQRVRDVILEHAPEPYDEFAVTALASLGPDLDSRAEAFLIQIAATASGHLDAVVEEIGPILALSATRPDLLIRLAEAYYIQEPAKGRHSGLYDDWFDFRGGIRGHGSGRGIAARLAAWYHGPFFRLLNDEPVAALGLINRILDRAAQVDVSDRHRDEAAGDPDALQGVDLGFGSLPSRRCIGSERAWIWYRGSSVGPYPCMSALLAVERFADHLITNLGVPIHQVAETLMRDAHNLAMPGLVAGLLIRHRAFELLDGWLIHPELWHCEFNRLASEGVLHVQGGDEPSLVGRERRRYTFREAAAEMTIAAVGRNDERRLAELGAIADALVRRARELIGDAEGADSSLATVEGWAAALRPENYSARAIDNQHLSIEFSAPEAVASRVQAEHEQIERHGDAIRLLNTYARDEARLGPVERLQDDMVVARRLADSEDPGAFFLDGPDPVAAVAAVAMNAAAYGVATMTDPELDWAMQVLINAALSPRIDQFSIAESFYGQGADRSAAAGLPAAGLTAAVARVGVERYTQALVALGRSLFDEVRAALVVGAGRIWARPCTRVGASCLHEAVWVAIEAGIADSRLGGYGEDGHREPDPLPGPYVETLSAIRTEDLYLNRLVHPLVAAWDASTTTACVAKAARLLLPVLVEAHRRVAAFWAIEGYGGFSDRDRRRVAAVLIRAEASGTSGYLAGHLLAFADNGAALQQLLSDMSWAFTHDAELRNLLPTVWPRVMDVVLDAWELGRSPTGRDRWRDYAIRHLLPTPSIDAADTDIDGVLGEARRNWIEPSEIDSRIERWLPFAIGTPEAVDAIIELARCGPLAWQADRGLAFLEQAIGGRYQEVAGRSWHIADWLKDVRALDLGRGEIERWHRVVDGLAGAGDGRVARLQASEE
ncbi:MAG TPA: hypothetical protein VE011_06165 [Candidatus Dormibacteraeota bacterium]|nr:hypothetical protein [Candidatus Dormibacteraeota bacterium]